MRIKCFISFFVVRLKFQKRSELKFVSRTIPHSGGYNTPKQAAELFSKLALGFIPVILITFLGGAFFVSNSFADPRERDEVRKSIEHKNARWSARDTTISKATSAQRKKRLGSRWRSSGVP